MGYLIGNERGDGFSRVLKRNKGFLGTCRCWIILRYSTRVLIGMSVIKGWVGLIEMLEDRESLCVLLKSFQVQDE